MYASALAAPFSELFNYFLIESSVVNMMFAQIDCLLGMYMLCTLSLQIWPSPLRADVFFIHILSPKSLTAFGKEDELSEKRFSCQKA